MIEIRDYAGRKHYVAAKAVATIKQTDPSSQWHGIRAVVKLFDGTIIESSDTAESINAALAKIEGEKNHG